MTRIIGLVAVIWFIAAILVALGALVINAAIESDTLALGLMFLYAVLIGCAGQGLTYRVIHHG